MKLVDLISYNGQPSKTAFWFSVTVAVTLMLVTAITIRFVINPTQEFVNGLSGIALVLGIPNAILATAYTWGKSITNNQKTNGE